MLYPSSGCVRRHTSWLASTPQVSSPASQSVSQSVSSHVDRAENGLASCRVLLRAVVDHGKAKCVLRQRRPKVLTLTSTTKASGEPVADAGTVDCYTLRVDIRLSHMRLDPQQARPARQYSSGNGR